MTTVERLYPSDLVQEVGHVVMSAAWVEDKAGELIELVARIERDDIVVPAKNWAASGIALVAEFRKIADDMLADRLAAALERRNEVVHGVFIGGDSLAELESGGSPAWTSMKRKLGRSEPAQYVLEGWNIASLNALAIELSAIEDLVDLEISYAMGLTARPNLGPSS